MGNRLLVKMQQENWTVPASSFAHLWEFICRNTSFMIYTLYDLLLEEVYQLTCEAADACEGVVEFLDGLGKATPQAYGSFLEYLNSMGCVEQMILYLSGHPNLCTNGFYVNWIMDSYTFANGLNDRQPISKLLRQLLKNICQVPGAKAKSSGYCSVPPPAGRCSRPFCRFYWPRRRSLSGWSGCAGNICGRRTAPRRPCVSRNICSA